MVGKLLTSFIQWHSLVRTSWSRRVENKHIKELLRFWQKVNRTWVQWDIKHLLSKCLKIAVGTWFKSLGPSSLLPKPTLPDTKQNSEKKKVYFLPSRDSHKVQTKVQMRLDLLAPATCMRFAREMFPPRMSDCLQKLLQAEPHHYIGSALQKMLSKQIRSMHVRQEHGISSSTGALSMEMAC